MLNDPSQPGPSHQGHIIPSQTLLCRPKLDKSLRRAGDSSSSVDSDDKPVHAVMSVQFVQHNSAIDPEADEAGVTFVCVVSSLKSHGEAGVRIAEGVDQVHSVVVAAARSPDGVAVEEKGTVEDVAFEGVALGLGPDSEVVGHDGGTPCVKLENV